jgi:hypothetical protein
VPSSGELEINKGGRTPNGGEMNRSLVEQRIGSNEGSGADGCKPCNKGKQPQIRPPREGGGKTDGGGERLPRRLGKCHDCELGT